MAVIIIDPGHGGEASIPRDSSWNNAVGPNGTLEKTLTLDIGTRVVRLLAADGHRASATRTTDVNLRLVERAAVAKRAKAEAFVSLHLNASRGHDAQGTETLVELNHTARSARLSLAVQSALLPVTGLKDRNKSYDPSTRIKPQALGVLKLGAHDPNTAACLVEISFMDRADEEARLGTVAYREAIAAAIARAITAFVAANPVARSRAPVFGDAVEAETGSNNADAVARALGLGKPVGSRGRGLTDPEASERDFPPDEPFPNAVLRGAKDRFALARSADDWEDKADFINFINGLALEYFSADELLFMGGSNTSGACKNLNTFPPKALWMNIKNTVQMLDQIRAQMGASIRITSCYRSPAYNHCVGGEPNSFHSKFLAIDFTCRAGTPEIWRRVAARLRDEHPQFEGGIGVYHTKNFVHIDTRGSRSDWVIA